MEARWRVKSAAWGELLQEAAQGKFSLNKEPWNKWADCEQNEQPKIIRSGDTI